MYACADDKYLVSKHLEMRVCEYVSFCTGRLSKGRACKVLRLLRNLPQIHVTPKEFVLHHLGGVNPENLQPPLFVREADLNLEMSRAIEVGLKCKKRLLKHGFFTVESHLTMC